MEGDGTPMGSSGEQDLKASRRRRADPRSGRFRCSIPKLREKVKAQGNTVDIRTEEVGLRRKAGVPPDFVLAPEYWDY